MVSLIATPFLVMELIGIDNTSGIISEQMIRVVEHYPPESIVLVKGKVRQPPQPVQNATIHKTEILILEIHLVSQLTEHVPFTVYDAENIGKLAKKEDQEEEGESDVEEISAEEISTSSQDRPIKVPTSKPRNTINMNRLMDDLLTTMLESDDDVQRHNRSLPQAYRLSNRVVDLRTASSQAIFRIQSGICNLFRSYLDSQGFIEIHTPKLQGTATESGASVFEANYFGRRAYLAQSPQLAKQMCIAADFERVYEIGAVFRAEDSNTPRHLTEYTGLDLGKASPLCENLALANIRAEMALEEHYYEALDLIDEMLKSMWKGLYERYGKEIEIISHFYPHEKVLWLEKTPRLRFSEGIKLLIEDGWTDDEGNPPSDLEDLSTRAEIRLGQIVREKFKTDYYILDKFPVSVRPFYTMPDPENENFTNSFDIFMRGQEIISGGQRIHDAGFLEKKMRKLGIKPESMDDYMEGFRWGAPPHAGAGVGLERLTYLFLNLGNIRLASLFPRDPKSFPRRSTGLELRHPEASTTNPPWEERTLEDEEPASRHYQPLEKLIANYGDAANTSWLDDRYEIWRHPSTGAAQGFVPFHGFAITIGEPLCAKSQYPQVVSAYLEYLQTERRNLKPIWLMIGDAIEEYLGDKYNWRTLSPIAEDRVDPRLNQALRDHDLARKIRHAEHEKVKNFEHAPTEPLPEDLVRRIDARIREWKKGRRGTQVHLTEIMPWVDQAHRRYYYAASGNKDGRIEALVVLHQLAPEHGYQVKFSLEFPGAPSGTIESLNVFAMAAIVAREPEVRSMTYGTAATEDLVGGRNLGRAKVGMLKRSYETINGRLRLRGKREFREKLGAREERVYLAYPRGGLGAAGIKAILDFMQEQKH